MANPVFSIGHSVHPIEAFLSLLARNAISVVADVRSSPYSRHNPQFNREPLSSRLKAARIGYVFLGKELGARSEDPSCYIDGKVQYDRLAEAPAFQSGLDRIAEGALNHRIALLCAEKDPITCHRAILVCRHLIQRGLVVKHILEDGQIEPHERALSRLLAELHLPERDLFRTPTELHVEAYERRGAEIAYTDESKSGIGTQQ